MRNKENTDTSEALKYNLGSLLISGNAAPTTDDKLDILIKEYYIAAWGNGLESYNMIRRTGKPENGA